MDLKSVLTALEPTFLFLERYSNFFNGFTMAGVLLILFGAQRVTRKDLKEYFRHKKNLDKRDLYIAWGIFYIIFGTLILVSSVLTVSIYL